MTSINTNVPSLIAQRVLGQQNQLLNKSLERLSTGLRINRGSDDPAGLIASESLRAEISSINAAIGNTERAEQVVNVAEGGLQEINNLLREVQSLVGQSANEAGVSEDEKSANQLQIDSILQTIDRIANSTEFNGQKLLNGDFDFTTSNVADTIQDVSINSARLANSENASMDVTLDVLTSAQTAGVFLSTTGTLTNGDNGSITFEISGNDGVQQFTFASNSSQANIVDAINTFKDALGVSAAVSSDNSDRVEIRSLEFGSSQFARVKTLEGASSDIVFEQASGGTATEDFKDTGQDATVLINGVEATTDGTTARVATDGLDIELTFDGSSALNDENQSESFQITGGGANFNIAPEVSLASKVSLGIQTATTGNLGSAVDGFLSALKSGGSANVVNGDLSKAQKIVSSSIDQISGLRGRLGAFQKNTLGATRNNLGVTLENASAAESSIRDTDFAKETATLTRQQIISQAATQSLQLANNQPQQVLALLG